VTRFLVELKDRPTFLEFVKIGMNGGWDLGASRCYGTADVNVLEQEWINSLRKPRPVSNNPLPEFHSADGPPPATSDPQSPTQLPPQPPVVPTDSSLPPV